MEKAQKELYNEKFAFYAGIYDSKSPISIIPKEIIGLILFRKATKTKPKINREEAIQMAISMICEREAGSSSLGLFYD